MTNERDFYRELGRVPEVPRVIYEKVDRTVRRQALFSRAVLAVAALFIVALGTTGVLFVRKGNDRTVSPEVVAELQTVHNYLAGSDLDKEYESYALYEVETQE
jgi:hypothetical protein